MRGMVKAARNRLMTGPRQRHDSAAPTPLRHRPFTPASRRRRSIPPCRLPARPAGRRREHEEPLLSPTFLQALKTQRWDDHRYYHHSRINQALHLVSALSFIAAYALLFIDPALAAWLAWGVSMTTRQAGHFFFEPRGYDQVNQATHAHKEDIKIGYNLRRKLVLMALWAALPLLLWLQPALFGLIEPAGGRDGYLRDVGLAWLALGVAGLLFRSLHLFFLYDVQTGLVWATKIVTDPFHDAWLYAPAPLALLRGELIDPMWHARAATDR
jgi:hypothetical protein